LAPKAALEKESLGTKRLLKIAGCLLVAAFAQTTLSQQFKPWLASIDWLLLVVVYVSLLRDPATALLTATAAGILHDASTGGPAMGVNGLAKVLAAFVAYQISAMIVYEHFLIRLLTVAVASLVDIFTCLVFYRMLKFEIPTQLAGTRNLLATILLGLAVNLLVSLLLFPFLDRIFRFGLSLRRSEAMRSARRRW
jgi:rod shape-determining protein MreD